MSLSFTVITKQKEISLLEKKKIYIKKTCTRITNKKINLISINMYWISLKKSMYKKEPLQENQDRKLIKCRKEWLKETARQMKNEMIKRTGRESCR